MFNRFKFVSSVAFWALIFPISCCILSAQNEKFNGDFFQPSSLKNALNKEFLNVDEILFCIRVNYDDPHWYANIGYYCDDENKKAYFGNGKPDEGKLLVLNLKTGAIRTLFEDRGGSVRDPCVHYDGKKVLFSYRKNGTDHFKLYEINIDGTNLRQITKDDYDDYEAVYLPNDDIVFVSTRCKRWVNCWMTQVGIIYRCGPNGENIRPISSNTEHDNTPWVMPDGRILYTRWEYVDRSQVEFHHLWVMNPDGTGQMIYYGNMHPHTVMIDAKPVPNSDLVVANFSPGHGVNEHSGIATIVSQKLGPDDRSAAKSLHKGRLIKDPYPMSASCILAARDKEIVLIDGNGNVDPILVYKGNGSLNEPRPIMKRPREPIIPDQIKPAEKTGYFFLANIYESRNLSGIKKGEIKKLLILESLPKPVNFSGGPDLISWLGTFTLERVLGTVPVEEDGSAFFEVPAGRQLFFVALDEKDLSVKRMQSFTTVMPGEVMSCVGCHEQRNKTPDFHLSENLMALKQKPSQVAPFEGFPDVLDFERDVQPVLDKYCVKCHNYQKREGKLVLTGDLGPEWSHSYFSLLARQEVADGRNGLGNQPPRSIGSSASRLLSRLEKYGATQKDWRTVWLWIESGAPYAGTYAALRNNAEQNRDGSATYLVFSEQSALIQRRCAVCHKGKSIKDNLLPSIPYNGDERYKDRSLAGRPTADYERIIFKNDPVARYSVNILLNFSNPKNSSLILAPLAKSSGGFGSCGDVFKTTDDPDYKALLLSIEKAAKLANTPPRYGTPGFKPNRQYIREMKRFGILPASFDPSKENIDYFELDKLYWKSLWYNPPNNSVVTK
ncbi:MAG: hypothetical protein ACP5T0_12165 [Verrucomicrobiia bacterium]